MQRYLFYYTKTVLFFPDIKIFTSNGYTYIFVRKEANLTALAIE